MSHTPVAFAAISWIRTPQESEPVLEAINLLNRCKVPVVIADGGSPTQALETMRSMSNVTLFEKKGLGPQIFTALTEAARISKTIVSVQTDKLAFIKKHGKTAVEQARGLTSDQMIVYTRTPKAFAQYPVFQQTTERCLNYIFNDFLGQDQDFFYGPKIFSSTLVPYLTQINQDIGWGMDTALLIINHRLGLPFTFYPVDTDAPDDIDQPEAIKRYRMRTMQQVIESVLQGQKIHLS